MHIGVNLNAVTDDQIYFVYENQRWNPIHGFAGHVALPTDRHGWTDESGRKKMEKEEVRLPSNRWTWVINNTIGTPFDNTCFSDVCTLIYKYR